MILDGVKELAPTVGIVGACQVLGVPRSSFYQAQRPATPSAAPQPHPPSPRALSAVECAQIRELLNSERFASIEEARLWVREFVTWYNSEHRHSGIGLLPPEVVHRGQAPQQVAARQHVLDAAYAADPERFVRGRPNPPLVPTAEGINLPQPSSVAAAPATPAVEPAAAAASRVSAAAAAP